MALFMAFPPGSWLIQKGAQAGALFCSNYFKFFFSYHILAMAEGRQAEEPFAAGAEAGAGGAGPKAHKKSMKH
jgi:hypothetical protein